jgi:hypothetical protein
MATKSGTTKRTSKKGGTTKVGTKRGEATASVAGGVPGECLSFSRAGRIVQECARGPHDIDDTLEEVGFITANQRLGFRECVFLKVLENGCQISREDIPNDANSKLREVRDAIADAAE